MKELLPAKMTIPPLPRYVPAAMEFVLAAATEAGLGSKDVSRLGTMFQLTLGTIIENSKRGAFEDVIEITFKENWHELQIEIINRGLPVFAILSSLRERLRTQVDLSDREASFENLGRDGQRIAFVFPLDLDRSSAIEAASRTELKSEPEIRPLRDGEETALSELFYNVYEYNYVNDYVYHPGRLRSMRESGQLTSFVGVDERDRIIGHVGLVRLNSNPLVYEAALGVVDPRIKSRGLFGGIFHRVMEFANSLPMSYCVFDFVTNHDLSQKLVARYGTKDLALFVGCQGKETQAKLNKLGLGEDPEDMDRYTLLLSISPRVAVPFFKPVRLPTPLGETFGFLLDQLDIGWTPATRFDSLSRDGEFSAIRQPLQKAVLFDMHAPGKTAAKRLLTMWQQLLREGYQYAGVNVPLSAPGIGHLYDHLAAHGFFAGGFVPYRNSGELGFRFQSLAPTRCAFEKIKVSTETGRRLLDCVRADYERNRLI